MQDEAVAWSWRLLRAAFWVVHLLGPDGELPDVLHGSWPDLPLAGEVDFEELATAERGLRELNLIRLVDCRLVATSRLLAACGRWHPEAPQLLLSVILETAPPLWLRTATGEGEHLRSEFIPDDAGKALDTVIADPKRREAFLLARGRTVDARERKAIGDRGEEAVVAACRTELSALGEHALTGLVQRVSLISDELGYDVIAPRRDDRVRRLEVKATRSAAAEVNVFITRNEFTVGCADPSWSLVVVRVHRDRHAEIIGYAPARDLENLIPIDSHTRGQWTVARLSLSVSRLRPGLPPA